MNIIIAYEQRQLSQSTLKEWTAEQCTALRKAYPNMQNGDEHMLYKADHWLSYYIGAFWLKEAEEALLIKSKLDQKAEENSNEVNILAMLEGALQDPEAVRLASQKDKGLFAMEEDAPPIKVEGLQDNLTPLLVARFLAVMQDLVRKGMKKGYRRKTETLRSRIKGKLLVSANIRASMGKPVQNRMICQFDEFGFDCPENRYLKKALKFAERYVHQIKSKAFGQYLNYVRPAFDHIPDDIDTRTKFSKRKDPMYKEYESALSIARQLMERFGYSLNQVEERPNATPPFWIDMSKLFELYVLGKLKENGLKPVFQHECEDKTMPDFLIPDKGMVIDAKYKTSYQENYNYKKHIDDIRQLSTYARENSVIAKVGEEAICVFAYPTTEAQIFELDSKKPFAENHYDNFWKLGIKVPTL